MVQNNIELINLNKMANFARDSVVFFLFERTSDEVSVLSMWALQFIISSFILRNCVLKIESAVLKISK